MKGSGQEPLPGLGLVVSIEGNYVLCKHPIIFHIYKYIVYIIYIRLENQFLTANEFFSYSYDNKYQYVLVCTMYFIWRFE